MNKKTTINANAAASTASKKKDSAMRRFRRFLIWEAVVSVVCLAEQVGSVYMKETGIVDLRKNPEVVLGLKVVQRGTEFLMMLLLAYLVCLKTASKDFQLNYRFPAFTVPILCRGSGWCASEPHETDAEGFQHMEGAMHSEGGGEGRVRKMEAERREKKKEEKVTKLLTMEKMNRHKKEKRTFEKARGGMRPSKKKEG
ncbi:hypothetical protein TrRE_jg1227, partial [Triparma retinervis]